MFKSIKTLESSAAPAPLQIVRVDSDSKEIAVVDASLASLEDSLKSLDISVAVLAVMGAYRTGKSFLLDLILRYLRSSGLEDWLSRGGEKIEEGRKELGFNWRGGMEKCTEGIWVWSQPFIFTREDGSEFALILMDTQGAWDSRMSKTESSSVFGLTAALSSYLVYNVSMQIQEDKVENLHFFLECAAAAVRVLGKSDELFQRLDFLVRDWSNFEEEWTDEECIAQMSAHLSQHLDSSEIKEAAAARAVKEMFTTVDCWLLPHPGLKIPKPSWDGSIAEISPGFIKFLQKYLSDKLFNSANLKPKILMGQEITAKAFPEVLKNFVNAFKGLVPDAGNLAQAVARSAHLISKDTAVAEFKAKMQSLLSGAPRGLKPEVFTQDADTCKSQVLQAFTKATTFGPEEERIRVRAELAKELDSSLCLFQEENRRKTEAALTIFAGVSVLVVVLYLIDKLSDITCDWYSDTCVRFSAMLFAVYSSVLVVIISHAFMLYRDRGQVVAVMALMEMAKATVKLATDYFEELKGALFSGPINLESLQALVSHFLKDCYTGLSPVIAEIQALLPTKAKDDEKQE